MSQVVCPNCKRSLDDVIESLIRQRGRFKAQREEARRHVERVEKDRDHWRNCHDGQVATKRRLSRRYGELLACARELAEAVLTHDCALPSTDGLPSYGERGQRLLSWDCPECSQRWVYEASLLDGDRFVWQRRGRPSRRWRKAEAKRLADRLAQGKGSTGGTVTEDPVQGL